MDAVLTRVRAGDVDLDGVDPLLVPLLRAALSPDPARRPHADDVIAALERYAAGRAATVPTPRRWPVGRRDHPCRAAAVARVDPGAPGAQHLGDASRCRCPTRVPPPRPAPRGSSAPRRRQRVAAGPSRGAGPAPTLALRRAGRELGRSLPDERGACRPTTTGTAGCPRTMTRRSPRARATRASGCRCAPACSGRPHWRGWGRSRRGPASPSSCCVGVVGHRPGHRPVLHVARAAPLRAGPSPQRRRDGGRHEPVAPRRRRSSRPRVSLILPVGVALAGIFGSALLLAGTRGGELGPGAPVTLVVGGALGLAMLWWGPGGASLRRGSRSIVRRLVPAGLPMRIVAGRPRDRGCRRGGRRHRQGRRLHVESLLRQSLWRLGRPPRPGCIARRTAYLLITDAQGPHSGCPKSKETVKCRSRKDLDPACHVRRPHVPSWLGGLLHPEPDRGLLPFHVVARRARKPPARSTTSHGHPSIRSLSAPSLASQGRSPHRAGRARTGDPVWPACSDSVR